MKRKTVVRCLLYCTVIALVAGSWISLEHYEHNRLAPPPEATTFEEFVEFMRPAKRLAQIQDGDRSLIVWIGDTKGTLASGPSCYTFDTMGQLVDWAAETGDGQRVTRYVEQAWKADPLEIESTLDALNAIRLNSKQRVLFERICALGASIYVHELGVTVSFAHGVPPLPSGGARMTYSASNEPPQELSTADVDTLIRLKNVCLLDLGTVLTSESDLDRLKHHFHIKEW